MKFVNKEHFDAFLNCLSFLGQGSQGICYLDSKNRIVYKVLHEYFDEDENIYFSKDDLLKFSDIKNKTFIWPTDIISVDGKVYGYIMPYKRAKNLNASNPLMVNNYGIVDINYDNYVANEIAMFNSLFSYANDELYKNNNKYSNLNSDGLDYGMLNLSGIRLNTINLNDNVITRLLSEKIRIQKEISKINDMITIYNSNLDIVILKKNIKAIEKISELLKSEFEKLDVLQSLYTATENSLSFARTYYNNNVNCLTNEAIITGIRNSIAHGNYNIVNDDDKIKIVFNDKVNNKLVFSCEVFINDFRDILINSAAVVKSFIDNKYNDKNIVKVKSLVIV